MNQQCVGDYCVDIVMCIDATGSMKNFIESLRSQALSLYDSLVSEFSKQKRRLPRFRVKVIVFRDYWIDDEPMIESDFFVLPEQNDDFKRFVDGIKATGGGDVPENALEAIALAIKSNWATECFVSRHVILVFSDSPALNLGDRANCSNYPADLPKDMEQLNAWWEGRDKPMNSTFKPKCGRLIMFVPKVDPWTEFESWKLSWSIFPEDENELYNFDTQKIAHLISLS